MTDLYDEVVDSTVHFAYKYLSKQPNKRKIQKIVNVLTGFAFSQFEPYLYGIIAVITILFLMNCFQFYFYVQYLQKLMKAAQEQTSLEIWTN